MKAFAQVGELDEVLELAQEMKQSNSGKLNVFCYNTVMNALVEANYPQRAQQVFDEMSTMDGVAPNVSSYNILVKMLALHLKEFDSAYKLIEMMAEHRCLPDSTTFSTLITGLCRAGRFEEVEGILRESSSRGWKPDDITYNTYMDGLCKGGKSKVAYKLLGMMEENGICPDKITLSTLLDCLCHESRFFEAICLLERSLELDLNPGVAGYNNVMSSLCKVGRWSAVLKLLTDMIKKGVEPKVRTHNIVIHSLCKAGKLDLAGRFLENSGFISDATTYNTLIHWCFKEGKINEAKHLFYDMVIQKQIAPDLFTHSSMIHGLCCYGKYLEASDYFLAYLREPLLLNIFPYLFDKLVKYKRYKEIRHLFEGMVRDGHDLDGFVFHTAIKLFCNRGFCNGTDIHYVCLVLDKMLALCRHVTCLASTLLQVLSL
ncbi:Putative pentatricopeptide repeat-containing protein [Apostasia shenzhenica]|uniref:Pentatricopeptide repeat-containing protein n=1 Tax=Apostasia shenzhenica TaxID=1088818 RepID=A0A2H9ZYB7_9ASPA|nr:Putative pentatricopeptide repeat-containing protein [Apostasia shenzhenica]